MTGWTEFDGAAGARAAVVAVDKFDTVQDVGWKSRRLINDSAHAVSICIETFQSRIARHVRLIHSENVVSTDVDGARLIGVSENNPS